METKQIRNSFLNYFRENGHKVLHSSSLVPNNDPTLMFTNAGMVQFKNYFTGDEIPAYKKVATSQKCVRAGGKHNDLENVGYTARHHTFFEMLGNFAFDGEYFKESAIELAWNYLTKELGIDAKKLYITIFHDDEEAYNIWRKLTGFSESKILRIATSDNFWSMGEFGPCGPCSEIFFDHGKKYRGGLPGTPEQDGDRYIEIWNLVFMQYEQLIGGQRKKLPKPAVDTGVGIERVAAVLQGVNDNYQIDLFKNITGAICELVGKDEVISSHKVIADHLRSSAFLIADGVMPSNEGRGYVLRRIMRRAMRHIYNLGYRDVMLPALVPVLINEMGDAYPELKRAEAAIKSVLQFEEERFSQTLGRGMKLLDSSSKDLQSGGVLGGDVAFKLYDTYGFPLDLTTDILKVRGIKVDEKGFESSMQEQKARAKAAWIGSGEKAQDKIWYQIEEKFGGTEFLGYGATSAQAKVIAIVSDGVLVEETSFDDDVIIFTNQTPFYAESGGQVGDNGLIAGNVVHDTRKYANGIFGHHVKIQHVIKVDDSVELKVNVERRNKIRANHSATHLLHHILRSKLGPHVTQKGSIVTHDKLRFDFSHQRQLSSLEIEEIEKQVNLMIIENSNALTEVMPPQLAIEKGAMALFGEKYGEQVRVVAMGESIELCGGTHVSAAGDIGMFKIAKEESIAAGVRRIEAVTGIAALEFCNQKQNCLREMTQYFKCSEFDLLEKAKILQQERKDLEKEFLHQRGEFAYSTSERENISGIDLVMKVLANYNMKDLKSVAEVMRKKISNGLVIIASCDENTSVVINSVGNIAKKVGAGNLIKIFIETMGGKGGGNPAIAQAGGCESSKLDEAISAAKTYIKNSVSTIS